MGAAAAGREFRQGYRAALGEVVRGLLAVDAELVEVGELIAALSRYEEAVDAWLATDDATPPPAWHPTAGELGSMED